MTLNNRITEYFKDRPEVLAVYLFGSYAKGGERSNSDIDLGILLKHQFISNENESQKVYLLDLTTLLRMDIHIVLMNHAGEGILSQIFKYGKCIVNNSVNELNKFKMMSYSKIAYFSYQKNIMEQGFINNIFMGKQ